MTSSEFKKRIDSVLKVYPEWRYGQAVFNEMYFLFPERADRFRGTMIDPFYNNARVDSFIVACLESWEK